MKRAAKFAFLIAFVGVLLLAGDTWYLPRNAFSAILMAGAPYLRDPGTLRIFAVFLALNLGCLVVLQTSKTFFASPRSIRVRRGEIMSSALGPARDKLLIVWLFLGIMLSAVVRGANYHPSIEALMPVASCVLGLYLAAWATPREGARSVGGMIDAIAPVIGAFVICLAVIALWSGKSGIFEYHDRIRWSGPWHDPNIAGLLMAAGAVLALGVVTNELRFHIRWRTCGQLNWPFFKRYVGVFICTAACIGLLLRLCNSLSRGALFAVCCGSCGLVWSNEAVGSWGRKVFLALVKSRFSIGAIVFSIAVLGYCLCLDSNLYVVRRAFAVVNSTDFSSRNRISAWEGALQVAGDRPWFGAGLNQAEQLYDNYYRASKIEDGRAIEMNDYLMLGATLGIPALFCFGMYLWLSLTGGGGCGAIQVRNSECGVRNLGKEEGGRQNEERDWEELEWLKTTCRAGAIVLLVGFWFDGGLFKLATASTFWILLELGSTAWNGEQRSNQGTKESQTVN
jgi:hypothetical protein